MGNVMDWELLRGTKMRPDVRKEKTQVINKTRAEQLKELREERVLCPIVSYLLDVWPKGRQ